MIIAKLVPPVTHFRARYAEWMCALVTVGWCIVLSQPNRIFDQPQFAVLRLIGSERWWTWVCAGLAAMRIAALWVNGAWRPTPFVRILVAALSLAFWVVISLGMMASHVMVTGLAVYPVLAITELYSIHLASMDARVVWDQSRKVG